MVLPPLMAWSGRYHKKIATGQFQVWGGKYILILELVVAALLIGSDLMHHFH